MRRCLSRGGCPDERGARGRGRGFLQGQDRHAVRRRRRRRQLRHVCPPARADALEAYARQPDRGGEADPRRRRRLAGGDPHAAHAGARRHLDRHDAADHRGRAAHRVGRGRQIRREQLGLARPDGADPQHARGLAHRAGADAGRGAAEGGDRRRQRPHLADHDRAAGAQRDSRHQVQDRAGLQRHLRA